MKKLVLFCATVVFSSSIFAYPITPRPLRKVIIESEYIIQGKVLSLGTMPSDKKNKEFWDRDYAIVMVTEMLQGKIYTSTIKVYYTARMICPAPAVFIENDEIIAFLDSHEKIKDGFTVHALSYGVKSALGKDGITIYKTRIREMQQILAISNAQERKERTVEWLVNCVEKKVTRWEGTYELSHKNDFMSSNIRDEHGQEVIFLNSMQKKKLFAILLQTDTLDYSDVALFDIVRDVDDIKLLAILKTSLPKVDEEYMWPAGDIMERIVGLTGNDELEKLWKQFAEYLWDEKKKIDKKKIFNLFIQKMENAELRSMVTAKGFLNS